jgi:hypothetical protein
MTRTRCERFIKWIKNGETIRMDYETLIDFIVSTTEYKLKCKIKVEGNEDGVILTAGS